MFVITDAGRLLGALELLSASLRPRTVLTAENLLLRSRLALYRGRNVKARWPDRITGFASAFLAGFYDNWREVLMAVEPRTLVGWHCAGFRLLWR